MSINGFMSRGRQFIFATGWGHPAERGVVQLHASQWSHDPAIDNNKLNETDSAIT